MTQITNSPSETPNNNSKSKPFAAIPVGKIRPLQNINKDRNSTPSTITISPVASTSTTTANNNNNTPTVQDLANEFNTMQEDVSLLKSMLGNLTSMLQNAIG